MKLKTIHSIEDKTSKIFDSENCRNLLSTYEDYKTTPGYNASVQILQNHGLEFSGIVPDDEIGDAWLWLLKPKNK